MFESSDQKFTTLLPPLSYYLTKTQLLKLSGSLIESLSLSLLSLYIYTYIYIYIFMGRADGYSDIAEGNASLRALLRNLTESETEIEKGTSNITSPPVRQSHLNFFLEISF